MKKRMFALLITVALLTACSGKTGPAGTGKAAETTGSEAQKTENAAAQKVEGAITDALEKITGSIPESVPAGEIAGGASLEKAQPLEFNTRYHGRYTEGEVWVSFTTGPDEDVPYTITVTNLTPESPAILGYVCGKDGEWVKPSSKANNGDGARAVQAGAEGTANSGTFESLEPKTTYYLRITCDKKADYSLRITDPKGTPFDPDEDRRTLSESDPFEPGLNQDEAPLLLANTRYTGKYTEGFQWVAFHTGAKEDVPYRITLENLSGSKEPLDGYLVNEYGTGLKMTAYRNGDNDYRRAVRATNDGTADTAMFDYLTPDTTYYLRLQGRSKVEYVLTFGGPEESVQAGASSEDAEGFVTDNTTDVPGTSQSFALNIPLETKVSGRYTDGYSWLAFTTTDAEDAKYYLTLINCSVGSGDLDGYLVDGYGNGLRSTERRNGDNDYRRAVRAKQDGRADTAMFDSLTPNTTYYLRLQGKSKADYTFKVSSPSAAKEDTYTTSSSLSESVGKLDENAEFYTGTNQNIATMLKTNTRYHGHYTDGYSWVAFTTGEEEGGKYYITLENLVPGSQPVDGYLVDAYGTGLKTTEHRNGDNDYRRAVRALEDGTADTAMFDYLAPDTTYYLWIESKSKAEYFLTIGAPEPKESENTIQEEEAPFVVAYELNETQVRFVKNEAIFINEEEAREAAAPVAEILLADPGLTVLLAGTTAEYGSQESCVKLSQRRADAVKNLLTEAFGVPETQLVTAGLGYEDDPFERGRDWSGGSFVETEAAKNRRVVIINAETEIAKSIISGQ